MILAIGETLVDIFPSYSQIGGAPFNFAYHVKHLGMGVRLVTRIGDDPTGSSIFSVLGKNSFETDFIQIDHSYETGRVNVIQKPEGGHEFDIIQNAAYDHIELPGKPSDLSGGKKLDLIYFGTLIQRTPSVFTSLQAFLSKRDAHTKCFCDINLRHGNFNNEVIEKSLENTDILKLNDQETDYLRNMFQPGRSDPETARWLIQNFGIEIVCITRGGAGSEIITADDNKSTGVPDSDVVDTVGAGDAYAAVLAAGYLKRLPLETIISTATAFSSKICRIKGAVPEDTRFYEPFQKKLAGAAND